MELRNYQQQTYNEIYDSWDAGHKDVLAVLPTGAGKTVLFSKIIKDHVGPCVALAHRQELVCQMALSLARFGVYHRVIAPPAVIRNIVKVQMAELGRSYYDCNALCGVVGVDTLVRRHDELRAWCDSVTLYINDEAHHCLVKNKWGKAASMFPNAKILGVTATPLRADGMGLSRDSDGIFDKMIVGPSMRGLIDMGYLTEYRIFAPPSDLDLSRVELSKATGDYSKVKLIKAVEKSHIVGDVVNHYKRIAPGKLGITFCVDVATATETAEEFNAAGVPAAVVSAKTPDLERSEILNRFKRRELLQLVNVDLFGEGFDLPAIEVVSMARPTQSYGLYVQKFGRALRILEGKTQAIIIDHVGNVIRHGLPDRERVWSMNRREKRKNGPSDAIPCKTCVKCTAVYERIYKVCPECGHLDTPVQRDGPQHVDGDLMEMDADTLAKMREAVEDVDKSFDEVRKDCAAKRMPDMWTRAAVNRHAESQEQQKSLRNNMAQWAGNRRQEGHSDSEIYRLFYLKFGVDMLTAQGLKRKDALVLDNLVIK